MLRHLLILLIVALLFSCSRTEKYRSQIEDISDQWESLASDATDLSLSTSENIKKWQVNYHELFSSINIDDLSEEEKVELDQLKMKCLGHGDVFVEIQEIMDSRIKDIESKGLEIQQLMLALEGENIPDDVDDQLNLINQFLDSTDLSIKEYLQLSENTLSECSENCQLTNDSF